MHTKNYIPLVAVVTGLLIPLAFPLQAAEPGSQIEKQTVDLSDLDLSRQAGVVSAYKRMRYAAENVCLPDTTHTLKITALKRQCMRDALTKAVASLNVPKLNEHHLAMTGEAPRNTVVASRP